MKNITVIDSIMGSGKTTWAINYMKSEMDNLHKSFIYIALYLTEVTRIQEALPEMHFEEPLSRNSKGSKLEGIKSLFRRRENITTTHKLFQMFDLEVLELIQRHNYVLILDEVIEVVDKFEFSSQDEEILTTENAIAVENNWLHGKKPTITAKCFENYSRNVNLAAYTNMGKSFIYGHSPRCCLKHLMKLIYSHTCLMTITRSTILN